MTLLRTTSLAGEFELVVRDGESLKEKRRYPIFPNVVLDNGLELMGAGAPNFKGQYVQVGTNNTPADVLQTSLIARVGAADFVGALPGAAGGDGSVGNPYYARWGYYYRFAVGAAAGNLTELGIGPDTTGNLFSRALIADSSGAPIAITVLSDEVLDVNYYLRSYQDPGEYSGNITLNGVNYTYQTRTFDIDAPATGSSVDSPLYIAYPYVRAYASPNPWVAITAPANLTGASAASEARLPYLNGSKTDRYTFTWGLNAGNMNIKTVYFNFKWARMQLQFDTPVPKLNTQTLQLDAQQAWARHVF